MNKQERAGIGFGFSLILIWLILLTGFIMYGKIIEGVKVNTIVLPPPLEVIEVEGGIL